MIVFLVLTPLVNAETQLHTVDMYVFYGQGCPHCARMIKFLDSIKGNYPNLNLQLKEVYGNQDNRELFQKFCEECNSTISGVPTTFIDGKMYVGFSNSIAEQIEAEIKRCSVEKCKDYDESKLQERVPEVSTSKEQNKPAEEKVATEEEGGELTPKQYHTIVGWAVILLLIIIGAFAIIKTMRKL